MTQEEKARAYDKAIEKIKYVMEHGVSPVLNKEDLQDIFPELKGSEDERIREAQLDYWRSVGGKEWHGVPVQEAIAWLEKQGEQKSDKNIAEIWKDMRLEVYAQASGNRHEANYSDNTTKMFSLNDIDEIIEKISEQKVSYTTLVETGNGGINALVTRELSTNSCDDANYCSGYINKKGCINCENEDMKETEHKVKSKFKVGDWIACKELNTALIVNVYDDKYEVEFIDGNKGFPHINYVDRFFHLWTIADAKPEDVLLSKHNQPFIYNGIFDEESIGAYCGIDKLGNDFLIDAFSCDWSYKEGVKPATKEQRDFLFQKMKESSYEWDNEKKEVKKIVPIFNVGDIIAKKHNSDINKFGQFTITDVSNGKYWYDESIICDITEQDDWELVEQKSAKWSKEDDKMLDKIINALIGAKNVDCADYSIMYDWLNLIEQRIEV